MSFKIHKNSFAYKEINKEKSMTPLVDEILSMTITNSPRQCVEIIAFAKELEINLENEKKLSSRWKVIVQKIINDKNKILAEATISSTKKKVPSSITAFDGMSNDEVIEMLKLFGFSNKDKK